MEMPDTLVFVDGENIALRYQEMLKAGRNPAASNVVVDDCFVWNQSVLEDHYWNIRRISYYTSVVGDDDKIKAVRSAISNTTFKCRAGRDGAAVLNRSGQLIPFVRKKDSKSRKESICDIAIAVDVMRACYRDHTDTIWIFTGDGDFRQLFSEVVHSGKRVYVSAFSSGLHPEIPYAVDEFISLDKYFFAEARPASAPLNQTESEVSSHAAKPATT